MLAPANPKLHQHIPVSQGRQQWRPLTESGVAIKLSGSVGWTARLGSESEPLGSEPRLQGEERDARPYRARPRPPGLPWSRSLGRPPRLGSIPGSRVTPPGRQVPASAGDPRNRQVQRESGWPGRALVGTPGDGCRIVPNTR